MSFLCVFFVFLLLRFKSMSFPICLRFTVIFSKTLILLNCIKAFMMSTPQSVFLSFHQTCRVRYDRLLSEVKPFSLPTGKIHMRSRKVFKPVCTHYINSYFRRFVVSQSHTHVSVSQSKGSEVIFKLTPKDVFKRCGGSSGIKLRINVFDKQKVRNKPQT